MTGYGIGTNSDVAVRVRIVDRLYLSGGYRVWWNRVLFGDQWKINFADGSSSTAPLTKFESLRHGPTVSPELYLLDRLFGLNLSVLALSARCRFLLRTPQTIVWLSGCMR
ncbi:MAG: hypothetical protein U0361_23245 [Nitrospiraceae bacterium]